MIVSIHIPKTAGTTVGYLLDYGSRRRILFDYQEDYLTWREKLPFLLEHAAFIEEYMDIVHGHFYFKKWQAVFPEARFITCVRHPVSRVISQYLHVLNSGEGHFGEAIQEGLSIVDYASVNNIGNAQSVFLDGRDLDDYDFVFLTEDLERSFALYEWQYGFRRLDPMSESGNFPTLNTKASRPKTMTFSDDVKQEIFRHTYLDNDLYRRAEERHRKLVRKAGF